MQELLCCSFTVEVCWGWNSSWEWDSHEIPMGMGTKNISIWEIPICYQIYHVVHVSEF